MAVASGQQFQLVSECQVLKGEILVCPERGPENGDEGEAESDIRGSVSEIPREGQKLRADRNIGEGQGPGAQASTMAG